MALPMTKRLRKLINGRKNLTKNKNSPANFRTFNPNDNLNSVNTKAVSVIAGAKFAVAPNGDKWALRWRGCVG